MFFADFVPFIVTAVLPTVISAQWRSIESHRLTRDEQTWLSTTYVQIYAFLQVGIKGTHGAWQPQGHTVVNVSWRRLLFVVSRVSNSLVPVFVVERHPPCRAHLTPPPTPTLLLAAVGQVTWTKIIRANPEHAWVAKVPTWPLTLVFLAQFGAIAGAVCEFCTRFVSLRTSPFLCLLSR